MVRDKNVEKQTCLHFLVHFEGNQFSKFYTECLKVFMIKILGSLYSVSAHRKEDKLLLF